MFSFVRACSTTKITPSTAFSDVTVVPLPLEVVKNYDRIRRVRAKGGTARVAFEKRVDGLAVVVEAARTKEKTLAFFTMWIEKQ